MGTFLGTDLGTIFNLTLDFEAIPSLDRDDDLLILELLKESWSDSEAVEVMLDFLFVL